MEDNRQNNHQNLATQTNGPSTSEAIPTIETVQPTSTPEVPQSISAQVQRTGETTLEIPTREFLDKNHRKPDLQKRCRELGLTNIWSCSKSQLIDMIIGKTRLMNNGTAHDDIDPPSPPRETQAVLNTVEQSPSDSDTTQVHNDPDMQEMQRKIMIIMSKLEIKDSEIDLLNTEIRTAYHTI